MAGTIFCVFHIRRT